jgi:anti-sigma factor RsiW
MSEDPKGPSLEVQYLLGDLSPAEADRVEEAFFEDDQKYEELELAETELIDAFVNEALAPTQRKQFEAQFRKSPALRERVAFARLLKKKLGSVSGQDQVGPVVALVPEQHSPPKRSWWITLIGQPAFSAAVAMGMIIVFVGGTSSFVALLKLRDAQNQLAADRRALAEQTQAREGELQTKVSQLEADLQKERDARADDIKQIEALQRNQKPQDTVLASVVSILLFPGSQRSEGADQQELKLHENSTAKLKIVLPSNDYSRYNVSIETADNQSVVRRILIHAQRSRLGPLLVVSVQASHLPAGDYLVNVEGVKSGFAFGPGTSQSSRPTVPVSDYRLRVSKR